VTYVEVVELAGKVVEAAGVAVIVLGIVFATVLLPRHRDVGYRWYRRRVGRSILLGLEFLVAGDIIRTVAVTPTLLSVAVLGAIVVIRTFLSFSLEVELEGRWPWQRRPEDEERTARPAAG
jgi:uncharacterized membrane protein